MSISENVTFKTKVKAFKLLANLAGLADEIESLACFEEDRLELVDSLECRDYTLQQLGQKFAYEFNRINKQLRNKKQKLSRLHTAFKLTGEFYHEQRKK